MTILCLFIALSGCGAMHSAHESLQAQQFQTPMLPVSDMRAVFAGDSITFNWPTAQKQRDIGMPGQGSSLIGARFAAEIAAGSPRYVSILAGTNDNLSQGYDATINNVIGMISLAQARHIPSIVGTLPPMNPNASPTAILTAPYIAGYNVALKNAVSGMSLVYVADYYTKMILPDGEQNPALFVDGIHPNAAGYAVMDKVFHRALRKAFRDERAAEGLPPRPQRTNTQRAAWRAAHPTTQTHMSAPRAAWQAAHTSAK